MTKEEAIKACGGICPDCGKLEPLLPYSKRDTTAVCVGCAMNRSEKAHKAFWDYVSATEPANLAKVTDPKWKPE
jgi:hypothetical protein